MPEYQPRGREFGWPAPWEGIGLPWRNDAREHNAPFVTTAETDAARADLVATLREQPGTFWLCMAAERQLNETFKLRSIGRARTLLATAPGSSLIDARRVWCAEAVAGTWIDLKRRVHAALKADALMTFDEVKAATGADATSLHAAIATLIEDNLAVSIQDRKDDGGPFYIRSRGVNADYRDVYTARMAAVA